MSVKLICDAERKRINQKLLEKCRHGYYKDEICVCCKSVEGTLPQSD